ncbi:MAG: cation diffusion facilitator family transporter [Haloarculaceae archaeon]
MSDDADGRDRGAPDHADGREDAGSHEHESEHKRDAGEHEHAGHDGDAGHAHAHDHGGHGHGVGGGTRRGLKIALAINTAFFVVEIAGALYANSLTLLADAAHMLTDSATLLLALFAAWVATLSADARRTFGYERAEILAALANGVFLLVVVAYIAYESLLRFQDPEPVKALPTAVVGVVGLGANLAGAYVLHGGRENLNVRGAYLHLLADAAGSLAAVALGVALYFTDLRILDPLFSLVIAALVLYSAKDLLVESVNILMAGAPAGVDVPEVAAALAAIEGVVDVHDVHVWALTNRSVACSAHVVVEGVDRQRALEAARSVLS